MLNEISLLLFFIAYQILTLVVPSYRDTHPSNYCFSEGSVPGFFRDVDNDNEKYLTIEAFSSGPIQVSVIRDPQNPSVDYFHVEDTQSDNSNSKCPLPF